MSELQYWQPAIVSIFGVFTVVVAAVVAFWLNIRRDRMLRTQEARAVAAAMYSEILNLRNYASKMAVRVATRYEDHGFGRHRGEAFDIHFLEQVPMPETMIYKSLGPDLGKLPPDILLGIVQFYAAYEEAKYWLPRLQEDSARGFSYGVLWVLKPALRAIEGVQPTLGAVESYAEISPPSALPEVSKARDVADWEEEQWAEIRTQ